MLPERRIRPEDGCSRFLGFRTCLEDGGLQNGGTLLSDHHEL
jgi:hypothetical protein